MQRLVLFFLKKKDGPKVVKSSKAPQKTQKLHLITLGGFPRPGKRFGRQFKGRGSARTQIWPARTDLATQNNAENRFSAEFAPPKIVILDRAWAYLFGGRKRGRGA